MTPFELKIFNCPKREFAMRKRHVHLFLLPAFVILLLTGCRSVELEPETVCGTWRQFGLDSRNGGKEVPFHGVYTVFLPDGTCRNEIRKRARTERYPGKWRIAGGEVEILDEKGNTLRLQYDPVSGKMSHTAYDKTFFPRGLKFVLIKESGEPAAECRKSDGE